MIGLVQEAGEALGPAVSGGPEGSGASIVVIAEPAGSGGFVIPDAATLFGGTFSHLGPDLMIEPASGTGPAYLVRGYFDAGEPASLLSPAGASLSGDTVLSLAGSVAPGQVAQLGGAGSVPPIGNVETVDGSATVVRTDGSSGTLTQGDPVYKGDVVSTGGGSALSITFIDDTVFSLSADARMVLDDLVYSPGGSDNSMVMNLVQGTFVFVTGQVAPTGDMKVETPVATMGIRGTTPVVQISAVNGETQFGLSPDPDGHVGNYVLFDKISGQIIGSVSTTDEILRMTSIGSTPVEESKTQAQQDAEQAETRRAFEAYRQSRQSGPDNQNNDGGQNAPGTDPNAPPGEGGDPLDGLGEQGGLGPNDGEGLGLLGDGPENGPPPPPPPGGTPPPTVVQEMDTLTITLPSHVMTDEDVPVTITGLSVDGTGNPILSVTLTGSGSGSMASKITLSQKTGLEIHTGDGVEDNQIVIFGAESDINAALNGMTYRPGQDATEGSLTIEVYNGSQSVTKVLPVDITPVNDPPQVFNINLNVDEGQAVTGIYLGTDPDGDVNLMLSNVSTPAMGTLFDNENGTFTFQTGTAFDYLNAGETATVTFQYTATDSTELTSSPGTVTITVHGTGNVPPSLMMSGALSDIALSTSGATATPSEVETGLGLTSGTLSSLGYGTPDTGAFASQVVNVTQGDVIRFTWNFTTEDYLPFNDFVVAAFGGMVFPLSSVGDLGNTSGDTTSTGPQSFFAIAPVSGMLTAGFAVMDVGDGIVDSDLLVTDLQVGTVLLGAVTELPDGAMGENSDVHMLSSVMPFSDLNFDDTHTVSVTPIGTGYLGILSFAVSEETTVDGQGQLSWSFSVPDEDLDPFIEGQSIDQHYELRVEDGDGAYDSYVVTVRLNGAFDPAVAMADTVFTNDFSGGAIPVRVGALTANDGVNDPMHTVTLNGMNFFGPTDNLTLSNFDQFPEVSDTYTYTLAHPGGPDTTATITLVPAYGETAAYVEGTENSEILVGREIDPDSGFMESPADDFLYGMGGDDHLFGRAGDDILVGGPGFDTLTGGDGADTFRLDSFDGTDIITDYESGDIIDITDLVDEYFNPGQEPQYLRTAVVGGNTSVFVDYDGTGTDWQPQLVAVVQGVTDPSMIDFVFDGAGPGEVIPV